MTHQFTNIVRRLRELTPARQLGAFEAESIAERQATELLALFSIGEPPVDVSVIAELPRVEVAVRPNRDMKNVSGISEWRDGRWLIGVNRDDSPTRRRFTLAHEFKHILDNPFIRVLYTDRYGRTDDRRAEDICDYFAACLLMPRPWVKYAWANRSQDVENLAAHFRVSPAAMARRLADLGLSEPHSRYLGSRSITQYFRQTPASTALAFWS
jgi:predicted transcriptional regulator